MIEFTRCEVSVVRRVAAGVEYGVMWNRGGSNDNNW
jgi:hypothetical protein